MNRHVKKLVNGLAELLTNVLMVAFIIIAMAAMLAPIVLAFEVHWAWAFLYLPAFLVWAYIIGDE